MIKYLNCSIVDIEKIYKAFKEGFSDYIIKLDIDIDTFTNHFFGPEGNQLNNSFIALDDDNPVGLLLAGIKSFAGIKTIRCGALCVHPDYRGKGISKELFKLHKETALKENCEQMILEVIVENDRAVKFYQNLGYEKIYDLSYYSCHDTSKFQEEIDSQFEIKKIDFNSFYKIRAGIFDIHINWQNDLDYLEKSKRINYFELSTNNQSMGALSISSNGKIHFLYTIPLYRNRGFGKALITKAVQDLKLSKLQISFPNNESIESFVKHLGFKKDEISQYEMYLKLE